MRIRIPINEMSKSELDKVEKYADKVLKPVDVEFTHHFLDRLTDPRNKKQISYAELIGFFKRLARHKSKFMEFMKQYKQFVVKYDRYQLNIPFVRLANQIVAKTIMRKKDFKSSNAKFKFEQYHSYLHEKNVKKGKWVPPMISTRGEELIDLVQIAYRKTPEGSYVNSKGDLKPSSWLAKDFDDDPELDVTVFYRNPRSGEPWKGNKIQGIGHDGSDDAKKRAIGKLQELLRKGGWWVEASDALEHVLYKKGVPYVADESYAQKVFPNSDLKFTGNKGQYTRSIGSKRIKETIFGKSIVK